MKTIEHEVYIFKDHFKNYPINECDLHLEKEIDFKDHYLKAKLIVEIPEKRITITESEFDKIVENFNFHAMPYSAVLDNFKKEIGFK